MKKLAAIPMLLLTIVALLFPIAAMAFTADGYSVVLAYPNVIMAVVTVLTLILSLMAIAAKPGWFATLLAFLLPTFTALNCLFFLVEAPSVLTAVLAVVCMLSVTIASLSCRRRVISFILILVFALLPLGGIGYISYEIITNPEMLEIANRPETILELASPEGGYTAVVKRNDNIYDDFNTSITLRFNEEPVNFVVGRLQREPLLVHVMHWEDFELSSLKWIDESTLLCDGNTYAITADGFTLIEAAEEAAAEAAEEVVEEPVAEATEAPAVEAVEASATETSEASAEKLASEEPAAEAAEAPAAEPTEVPAEETELAGAVVTKDGE